jgi:hypothetical protein
VIKSFTAQMRGLWKPGGFERGGNTKTHGIVRAELIVHDGLPPQFRHGVYAQPKTYRAWVRFSGPGPYVTPDIDDVGFMSISIKLMGIPGPKLMEEEQFTQDMFGVSTPTFVTPDTRANAQLQLASLQNTPVFYFLNSTTRTCSTSSCRDCGRRRRAVRSRRRTSAACRTCSVKGRRCSTRCGRSRTADPDPAPPRRPPDDYLRNAMVTALDRGDVELDVRLQLQTDPYLMPIENNAVLWPERLSPRVSVATLRIPKQKFDSPAQIAFARRLSFNPWHCIAEHRPLGNQSRARRRMYYELSKYRHDMNGVPHYEPNGDETLNSGLKPLPINSRAARSLRRSHGSSDRARSPRRRSRACVQGG